MTHSTLENADIENSISMTAYHRTDITNLEQLITADRLRTDTANTIFQKDAQDVNARIIIFTDRGLKYKGKSYYKFKNGIGYVINFTATPGTYEKNLPLFENFYNNVRYE